MTTTNNTVAQKNVTNVRLFVLFVLLVLSSNSVFGQEVKVATVTNTTTTTGESTKVYVTEQDISNTQNKVSVNEAQATI